MNKIFFDSCSYTNLPPVYSEKLEALRKTFENPGHRTQEYIADVDEVIQNILTDVMMTPEGLGVFCLIVVTYLGMSAKPFHNLLQQLASQNIQQQDDDSQDQ